MMKTWIALALALAAGCKDSSPAAKTTGDPMAQMTAFRDAMCACKDAECARRVSREMADWGKDQPDSKQSALTVEQQKQAQRIGTETGKCRTRATGGLGSNALAAPPAPPPVDIGSAGGGSAAPRPPRNTLGLPVECDDYKDAIARIGTCEQIAASARETLIKGYEDAATRWAAMNEATKGTLKTTCQGGLDAVLAIGKAQCGW